METHISRLYFVGDRVYKVKKPVRLAFLDSSDLDRRRFYCEEELRLNRRTAPDVYLRVAPIRRDAYGRVELDGAGTIVDWAVEMVRLPARDMFDAVLERGEVDNALVRDLALFIADFHRRSDTGGEVAAFGDPTAIARNSNENFEALGAHAGERGQRLLSQRWLERLRTHDRREFDALRELFELRVTQGRIRDGHGDLHAGNLCITPRGIVAYDCVEFAARFRCCDVANDLAFLAMDLDRLCYRGFSGKLVHDYAEISNDPDLPRLMPFYKRYRALIRAKVAAIRADQAVDGAAREAARSEAQRYLQLTASACLPPALILTCGLPASGKSWLARHLARPFEAAQWSSDVRRKILAHIPLHEHVRAGFDSGLYSPAIKAQTYDSLVDDARRALQHGRTVVVDAMFPTAARREPFRTLAEQLTLPFTVVVATADESEIRRRLELRAADPNETSDADWSVYERARAEFRMPDELAASQRVVHRSGVDSPEETLSRVFDGLLDQVRAHETR